MRKYTLSPSAKYIICTAIFLIAAAATFPVMHYLSSFRILMYVLVGIFWAIAVLFGMILVPMYFRRTVIYVSGAEITVHSGLMFLRRDHIKTSAVQYVTFITLPLSGISGFNFITIRAMGGSLLLPFLRIQDANEIENALHLEIQKR